MQIRKILRDLNIQELNNRLVSLSRGKARLHIAGLDDIWNGVPRMREVLSALPEAGAAVLLAHEPDYADFSVKTGRFDLQLSGHSHGGQVVLPLVGPPLLPEWGRKYPAGLYQVGNMFQYTNRGLGMTNPYMRLNCRPEITFFQFQSGQV
jgi:predicted MPP superfamily phosphohydrolase